MIPRILYAALLLAGVSQAGVTVRVDARVELLTVVQLLGGSQRINTLQQSYRTNILAYFGPHRDHAAVRMSADMERAGFSFDAPPTLMLHLSDPPELAVRVPYTQYLIQRAGGRERLDAFVSALRDFARTSRFSDFYDVNRGIYEAIEGTTRSRFDEVDYTGKLQDYYGQPKESYTIVLSLLLHAGGYGPAVNSDVYSLIGPTGVVNGIADFGALSRLRDILWHEFGHSFANPMVEQHWGYVSRFSSLYGPIEPDMRSQAYSNWASTMNEHLVRAVHVRLTCRELGDDDCRTRYVYERGRGFAYLDALLAKLKEYENSREQYPSLREFGQQLFQGLEAEQGKLTSLTQDTSGRIAIQAPRGVVKYRLFTLASANGGVLVRESAEESVYRSSAGPELGTFRYESNGGETIVSVEPNTPQVRSLLLLLKYAAEADPEMSNSIGMTVTSASEGRLRITYIREGSRAEAMGFRAGDVLVDWSTVYRFPLDIAQITRLRDLPEDASATVRIIRDGDPVEMQVNGSMR